MAQTERDYLLKLKGIPKKETKIRKPGFSSKTFFLQRSGHRDVLFWFALCTSAFSLLGLFALAGAQAYLRTTLGVEYEVMSDTGFQIFSVAVFGQVFGVVYVIANALWSNDEFNMFSKQEEL